MVVFTIVNACVHAMGAVGEIGILICNTFAIYSYSFFTVAMTIVFVHLLASMRRLHRYEYNQNKQWMCIFFVAIQFNMVLLLAFMFLARLGLTGSAVTYSQFYSMCTDTTSQEMGEHRH